MAIKNIIREVPPEQVDFSFYFDDDGLTSAGGDYCCNLFIISQSRNNNGFNEKEYQDIQTEIENLREMYTDIESKSNYAQYSSVGEMLLDYKLINNIHNTKQIKLFTDYFKECDKIPPSPYASYYDNFAAFNEDMTAQYLTLKTGKEWDTDSASGYCQGDYVKIVYCKEYYPNGTKNYGEIWLGVGKEFSVIELDKKGEEIDSCYGYIIADCQAWTDEYYKKLVCEWACIEIEETQLEIIESSSTITYYGYRTA